MLIFLPDTRGNNFSVWIMTCSNAQMRDRYSHSDDTFTESCEVMGENPVLNFVGVLTAPRFS